MQNSQLVPLQPLTKLNSLTDQPVVHAVISSELSPEEIFDMAAFFIKNYMETYIIYKIKEFNNTMSKNGEILIVTGGSALSRYFKGIPEFITLDYDIKLVYPVKLSTKRQNQLWESDLQRVTDLFNQGINQYFANFSSQIFNQKFPGVTISNFPNAFSSSGKQRVKRYRYKLQYQSYSRKETILDIYPITPELQNVYHYNVFTGKGRHNEILSRNAEIRRAEGEKVYYIPINMIDGIPYSALGYIIWDTDRMINDSMTYGREKLERYVKKKNAIIDGLNSLAYTGSCGAFEGLMNSCGSEPSCQIEGKTINEIMQIGLDIGLYPDSRPILQLIVDQLGADFICNQVKRIQSYPDYTPKLSIIDQ